jgi:hypothetical protein
VSGILPKGEETRRAIRFISDRLDQEAAPPLMKLIDEATLRFDLSPNQAEFLIQFYRKAKQVAESQTDRGQDD